MIGCPGISWGPDRPVNALRTSRGWLLVDFSVAPPSVVQRVSKRRGIFARSDVERLGSVLNYGAAIISRAMRAELDSVA